MGWSEARERGGVGGVWRGTMWSGAGASSEYWKLVLAGEMGVVVGDWVKAGLRRSANDGADGGKAGIAGMGSTAVAAS